MPPRAGADAGCVHKLSVAPDALAGLALSPDGSALMTACHDGAVRLMTAAPAKKGK